MLRQMPRFSHKKGVLLYRKDFGMSILTAKQAWYRQNRERLIEKARKWRLEHPDRYRELQRNAKRRKRKQLAIEVSAERALMAPVVTIFVPAPGWDYMIHGNYDHFCLARGIDPKKSWTEPTDEFYG